MTTDTTTLPALAEAMTARDILAWEKHLATQVGSKAHVAFTASNGGVERNVHWTVDPKGICNDEGRQYDWAPDWPSAIRAAQAWIANRPKVERNAVIRRLALAIIEITDERTKCTVHDLRAKGFDDDEIALHAEACVRAGEMANCAPFTVEGAP
jgi:hypothetical protein